MPQLDFFSFLFQTLLLLFFFNLYYFVFISNILLFIKYNFISREYIILKNLIQIFKQELNHFKIISLKNNQMENLSNYIKIFFNINKLY